MFYPKAPKGTKSYYIQLAHYASNMLAWLSTYETDENDLNYQAARSAVGVLSDSIKAGLPSGFYEMSLCQQLLVVKTVLKERGLIMV